jgi:uncharacterized protein (DUF58 family)
MRTGSALLLVVVSIPASCRNAAAPDYDLALSIEDSVVAKRSPNEVNFSVHVRVSNDDSRSVFYEDCGHSIQRREGTEWRSVFARPCLPASYSIGLSPGESRVFDLVAREPVTSTFWPATGAAGEYRVVLWLTATPRNAYGFSVQPLATSSRVSPTFSAKEVVIVF